MIAFGVARLGVPVMPNRVLIFVNKAWEADPLVGVFTNDQVRPFKFPTPSAPPQVNIPLSDGSMKTVQARLALNSAAATAEVWCIKDLMDPKKKSSSSEEKARVLPLVTANGDRPSLVVAFGTATFADARSYNGCVVVGSNVFVHNPYSAEPNPESNFTHPDMGKLLDCSQQPTNAKVFPPLDREMRPLIETAFLPTPINSADPPSLIVSAARRGQSGGLLQHGGGASNLRPELRGVAQCGRCSRVDDAGPDGLGYAMAASAIGHGNTVASAAAIT
jgi:hypothetical protein